MNVDARRFANEWIASWNSHDLEKILAHYSEDCTVTSPMIKVALEIDTGTLVGKERLRQ